MKFILRYLITASVAFFLPKALDFYDITSIKVHFDNFEIALIFALTVGLLNVFIKPIVSFFALPVTILTLGLFTLIINALIVHIADYFITGMSINGFRSTLIFSVLLSICTTILCRIFIKEKD
ncbi:MAG: phage holin family protein [Paludibacter sp.]|nr:phage holin family protein [Paludibacter sp.]